MRCIVSFEVEIDAANKGEAASKAYERMKSWFLDEDDRRDVRVWMEYRACPDGRTLRQIN